MALGGFRQGAVSVPPGNARDRTWGFLHAEQKLWTFRQRKLPTSEVATERENSHKELHVDLGGSRGIGLQSHSTHHVSLLW